MTARIEIVVAELLDVLCVPLRAVASRKGTRYCYVVSESRLERRAIATGQFNDTLIEVKQGLTEGEIISLVPPNTAENEPWEQPL